MLGHVLQFLVFPYSLPVIPPEVNGVWMVRFLGPVIHVIPLQVEGVWKPRDIDFKLEFHLKNDGNPTERGKHIKTPTYFDLFPSQIGLKSLSYLFPMEKA